MIGIYKIVSPSGKVYIGQSTNIERRWKEYKTGLGRGQIKLKKYRDWETDRKSVV